MDIDQFTDDQLVAECRRRGLTVPDNLPAVGCLGQLVVSFDDFWKLYPRKVSKREAAKAWERLGPDQRQRALDVIPAHTTMWIKEGRGTATIPHASTWLNQWRFDDEINFVAPRSTTAVDNAHTRSAGVLGRLAQR